MGYRDARAQENAIGTSRGTSAGEVVRGLKEYQAAIAASKEFEEFNDALKDALASAVDGGIVEGGAIGLAKSIFNKLTGRNLQRKLNNLQTKFKDVKGIQDIAANYQRAVLQHSQALDLLMQLNPKNPYANEGILTQLLGYKNKDRVMEVMKKPTATFLESKNRAIVDILISALGSLGGPIDVVL